MGIWKTGGNIMEEKLVNGKHYPLWQQVIDRKKEWIGGILQDFGDSFDRSLLIDKEMITEIINIELKPNDEDSAFFVVLGKDFDCGFSTDVGGISCNGEKGWLTFNGFMGHKWRIKERVKI